MPNGTRASEFKHEPLPPPPTDKKAQHLFRLIRLQQCQDVTDNLVCELLICDLDDPKCPKYEALSWCWGPPPDADAPKYSIMILEGDKSGRVLHVRKELHSAMTALRYTHQSRVLWIDHVSINQGDVEERNRQVSLMSAIYGRAFNVCIWLGSADATSDQALYFIRDRLRDSYKLDKHCNHPDFLSSWLALKKLMKRPWFSRRWIVQEVALAEKATIHCGDLHLPWEEFQSAVSIMVQSHGTLPALLKLASSTDTQIDHKVRNRQANFDEVPSLSATRLVEISNRLFKRNAGNVLQRISSLEEIVAWLTMFETGEPRDVIYSLLALAMDTQPAADATEDSPEFIDQSFHMKGTLKNITKIPKILQQRYRIMYEQPIVDVYQQFIYFSMLHSDETRALDIICRPFAHKYTEEQDRKTLKHGGNYAGYKFIELPSWMPDTSQAPWVKQKQPKHEDEEEQDLYRQERERGDLFVSTPDTVSYYSAAGSKKYKVRFVRRSTHFSMFVDGFVLDEVGEIVPDVSSRGNISGEWIRLGTDEKSHEKHHALIRTLVADRGRHGVTPAFYGPTLREALKRIDPNGSLKPDVEIQQTTSSQVIEVMNHVINTTSGRKLIRTKHYKLLGLVPSKAERGDLICILHGCSVPVILRRQRELKERGKDTAEDWIAFVVRRPHVQTAVAKWISRWQETAARKRGNSNPVDSLSRASTLYEGSKMSEPTSLLDTLQEQITQFSKRTKATFTRTATQRAAVYAMLTTVLSWLLGDRMIGCMLVTLCAPHYLYEMSFDNALQDHGLLMLIAQLSMAIAASGYRTFAVSALILFATWLWYPRLLPGWYGKQLRSRIANLLKHLPHTVDRIALLLNADDKTRSQDAQGTQRLPQHSRDSTEPVVAAVASLSAAQRAIKEWREKFPHPSVRGETVDLETDLYAFELIGESYIDQMMTGEAIRLQNESISKKEQKMYTVTFELR